MFDSSEAEDERECIQSDPYEKHSSSGASSRIRLRFSAASPKRSIGIDPP
jgi:hypothetical protein